MDTTMLGIIRCMWWIYNIINDFAHILCIALSFMFVLYRKRLSTILLTLIALFQVLQYSWLHTLWFSAILCKGGRTLINHLFVGEQWLAPDFIPEGAPGENIGGATEDMVGGKSSGLCTSSGRRNGIPVATCPWIIFWIWSGWGKPCINICCGNAGCTKLARSIGRPPILAMVFGNNWLPACEIIAVLWNHTNKYVFIYDTKNQILFTITEDTSILFPQKLTSSFFFCFCFGIYFFCADWQFDLYFVKVRYKDSTKLACF